MKSKKDALPRLTLKAAKTLVSRHLGISPAPLKREPCEDPEVYTYIMQMGNIDITVDNDWFYRSGLFVLKLCPEGGSCGTGDIRMLFNPDTLMRDCQAEWIRHDKDRTDDFAEQICSMGIEGCRHILEKHGYRVEN